MKKFAVFIATTGGPIQIERLTPERAPQSMICVSRSSNILPISGEYDDFVRRGSGIIEREFGPFEYESFRADISGSVGTGQSWQLPFFIAHAIDAAVGSELVEDVDAADYVVWATGRVDYDLNILDVDHIAEKIKGSHSLFEKIASSQSKAVIAAPASQISLLDEIPDFGQNFSVLPAESGFQVCKELGLELKPTSPIHNIEKLPVKRSGKAAGILAVVAIILWGIFYFVPASTDAIVGWGNLILSAIDMEQKTEAIEPEPPPIYNIGKPDQSKIKLIALKHPQGGSCLEVNFGVITPVEHLLPLNSQGVLSTDLLDGVCRLSFSIDFGEKRKYVAVWIEERSGRFVAQTLTPNTFKGLNSVSGNHSWSFELRRKKDTSKDYQVDRLAVLIGDRPVVKEFAWLIRERDWHKETTILTEKKVQLFTLEYRVDP